MRIYFSYSNTVNVASFPPTTKDLVVRGNENRTEVKKRRRIPSHDRVEPTFTYKQTIIVCRCFSLSHVHKLHIV